VWRRRELSCAVKAGIDDVDRAQNRMGRYRPANNFAVRVQPRGTRTSPAPKKRDPKTVVAHEDLTQGLESGRMFVDQVEERIGDGGLRLA
jgi:hypothetical protein